MNMAADFVAERLVVALIAGVDPDDWGVCHQFGLHGGRPRSWLGYGRYEICWMPQRENLPGGLMIRVQFPMPGREFRIGCVQKAFAASVPMIAPSY